MKGKWAWVVVVLIAVWAVGFGGSLRAPPKNAKFYIDHRAEGPGVYVSPPCYERGHFQNAAAAKPSDFTLSNWQEVLIWREEGTPMQPDPTCKAAEGFFVQQSFLGGIFWPKKPRWTANGEWNW